MIRLHLRVPSKDEWWRFYDANIAGGGIFCPSADPPQVGKEVRLEITFVTGPRFSLSGTVIWRRPQLKDPRARAGAGIKVHPRHQSKLSYVNAWVRGGVLDKREARRLPVRLRVTYTARTGRRINFTRDLSTEGIFVRSQELLDLGTPILLVLSPPGNIQRPYPLNGLVARLVDEPDERGMGIQLVFDSTEEKEHYAAFVLRLEQDYLAGELPDEAVG
jgi:Tfp pilus assembly protein PilZ